MAFKQQVVDWLSSYTGSMQTAVAALAVSTGCMTALAQAPPEPVVQSPIPATTEAAVAAEPAVTAEAAPAAEAAIVPSAQAGVQVDQGMPVGGGYIHGAPIDGGYQGMLPGGQFGETGQYVDNGVTYDSGQFIDNGQWGGEVMSSGGFVGEACNCYCTSPLMMGDSTMGSPLLLNNATNSFVFPQNFAKVADNNHVVPMDRISLGYRFYKAVPTSLNGNFTTVAGVANERDHHDINIQAEKTFFCGNLSAQVNVPFHHTTDLQQPLATLSDRTNFELGNLSFGLKALIYRTQTMAFSTGVLVEAPTADDITVTAPAATFVFENDSWFYTPYLGLEYTPNERWFAQGFASYRTRTSVANFSFNGANIATGRNPDRLMLDAKFGFWMYRGAPKTISGFAPTLELHYMGTTETIGGGGPPTFTSDFIYGEVDRINLTSGFTAEICNSGQLNFGIVTPLSQGRMAGGLNTNRMFDYNLTLQYNQRF